MKRILFIIQEYTQGGITKCLENLLGFFPQTNYEIFIYSLYEDGENYYKKVFADRIVKKSLPYYLLHDNVYTRKLMGAYNKLTHRYNFGFLYQHEAKYLQRKYNFDIVVAYHEGMTVEFASYFHNAKKITWFHCDPKILGKSMIETYRHYYEMMEIVVGVSSVVKKSFLELIPHFSGEVKVIYNFLDTKFIWNKSNESVVDVSQINSDIFSIISVGRSTKVKQFEKIPVIMRQVVEQGVKNVCWYIIAAGNECNDEISKAIIDNGMENHVRMLGEKDNPYPYIKQSDLLISTSYSEAYPTVINEAQTLGVPVIANNYPSAKEIVSEGCGFVCPLENMPSLICKLVKDEEGIYSSAKQNVAKFDYDNQKIFVQLNELFYE